MIKKQYMKSYLWAIMQAKNQYKWFDIIMLPFKISPFILIFRFILLILQSIISTIGIALSTTYFIDTAISIFNGYLDFYYIYPPLIILISIIGISSVLSNLPNILDSRIKFSFERNFSPFILDIQARLAYKYIEDEEKQELIDRISENIISVFQEGLKSYFSIIRSILSILSVIILIVSYTWWTALIISILSIPLFYISLYAGKKNYDAEEENFEY